MRVNESTSAAKVNRDNQAVESPAAAIAEVRNFLATPVGEGYTQVRRGSEPVVEDRRTYFSVQLKNHVWNNRTELVVDKKLGKVTESHELSWFGDRNGHSNIGLDQLY